MRDPAYLPPELFNDIVDNAIGSKRDVKSLCAMSLVGRQWQATLSPRIYSTWLYDGDLHPIIPLWKFLRTVQCNARIAKQVRTLNIRNWTFGMVRDSNHTHFSEEDIQLIRNAVRRAGIQQIESSLWMLSGKLTQSH